MSFENFELNVKLFRVVNSVDDPILNAFFYYFSFLGSGFVLIPVAAYLWLRNREKLKSLLLALLIETALVSVLKVALNQPRPALLLEDVKLLVPLYHRSFPSGDTAMAFMLAGVLSYGEGFLFKLLAYGYAVIIGIGRMYLGVHFPLDVLVGALIGLGAAHLSNRYLYRQKDTEERENSRTRA